MQPPRWRITREGTSPQSLKAKYDRGASIRELTEETGLSYGAVYRRLKEAKTNFRTRGGYHGAETSKET